MNFFFAAIIHKRHKRVFGENYSKEPFVLFVPLRGKDHLEELINTFWRSVWKT